MSDHRAQWKARAAECQETANSALAAVHAADTEELRVQLLLLAQEALTLAHEIEALFGKL